ncbi:MAG: DegT/DnrJ/EryC1/StrS family aminotransferase [Candidatus Omnitrophica bacterium]|nr:DegT/DnrJ/EryC1/StrS family aminotransferase [Candidatus Omnitrophota bacterium]
MIRKVPVIGHPIGLLDLFFALFCRKAQLEFCRELKDEIFVRHAYLANTGIASFYIVLSVLKKLSHAKEVILPCYTAPSLVVAVRRAGLKPVLCDISLDDFNADLNDLFKRINENTLCVVAVHMYGIPWAGIEELNKKRGKNNIFIVEDCAQAFGAKIRGTSVGAFGDIGFFSFNRGKNLPIYEGGCIVTESRELAVLLEKEIVLHPKQSLFEHFALGFKLFALSFAFKPFFYWLLYPVIARFKENSVPSGFEVRQYVAYPAAVGLRLLKKIQKPFEMRYNNSRMLLEALGGAEGLILPKIAPGITPMFNRMPVVIKDKDKVEKVLKALEDEGIECSRFYFKPLHHLFDLGYNKDEFPNAVYLAERLLTLPVHPFVGKRDIEKMVTIIRETISDPASEYR